MAKEASAQVYHLKAGGAVVVRDLKGPEDLELWFPRRVKVAETETERVWAAPPSLLFEDRNGLGRTTEYAFDESDASRKLIVEIIAALVAHEVGGRRAKPEEGSGSSGVPPVVVAIWPIAPKPDDKEVQPIWHRLTQNLKV